eukprot:gb/GECG01006949.1/.p1 GENE.gb/GECG01006949.1/~~gb/GECG01006949.1/.p1  ORF type:complete len:549 (+),score=54.43 gb/GECG01006949.1/:1-1647(+)
MLHTTLKQSFEMTNLSDALLQMVETSRLVDYSSTLPSAYTVQQKEVFGQASMELVDPFTSNDSPHVWPSSLPYIAQYAEDGNTKPPFQCKLTPEYAEMEDVHVVHALKEKAGRLLVHWARTELAHRYLSMEMPDVQRYNKVYGNVEFSENRGSKFSRHHAAGLLTSSKLRDRKAAKRFAESQSYAFVATNLRKLEQHIQRESVRSTSISRRTTQQERINSDLLRAKTAYRKHTKDYIAPVSIAALTHRGSLGAYDNETASLRVTRGSQSVDDISKYFTYQKSVIKQRAKDSDTTMTNGMEETSILPLLSTTLLDGSTMTSEDFTESHATRGSTAPSTVHPVTEKIKTPNEAVQQSYSDETNGSLFASYWQYPSVDGLSAPSCGTHQASETTRDVTISKILKNEPDWEFINSVYQMSTQENSASSGLPEEETEVSAREWFRPSYGALSVENFTKRVKSRLSKLRKAIYDQELAGMTTTITPSNLPEGSADSMSSREIEGQEPPEDRESVNEEHIVLPPMRASHEFATALMEAKRAIHVMRKLTPKYCGK